MTDALTLYTEATPILGRRQVALRRGLLNASWVVLSSAVVAPVVALLVGGDTYLALLTGALLLVFALNLLVWRWSVPQIAPITGVRRGVFIAGMTVALAVLSVCAVVILTLIALLGSLMLGWWFP